MTNHSGFLTRSSSFWGSRNVSILTFSACLISSAVLWRMKTGLPRHLMMTCFRNQYSPHPISLQSIGCAFVRTFLPSGMVDRSTSTLAIARTSADADMLTRKSVRASIVSHTSQLTFQHPLPPPSTLSHHCLLLQPHIPSSKQTPQTYLEP
jgi:hypothetical protein